MFNKYIFMSLILCVCSLNFAMDNHDKEMQEIQKQWEARRKEQAEKFQQMLASSEGKSAEEKAKIMAEYYKTTPEKLLAGSQKKINSSIKFDQDLLKSSTIEFQQINLDSKKMLEDSKKLFEK